MENWKWYPIEISWFNEEKIKFLFRIINDIFADAFKDVLIAIKEDLQKNDFKKTNIDPNQLSILVWHIIEWNSISKNTSEYKLLVKLLWHSKFIERFGKYWFVWKIWWKINIFDVWNLGKSIWNWFENISKWDYTNNDILQLFIKTFIENWWNQKLKRLFHEIKTSQNLEETLLKNSKIKWKVAIVKHEEYAKLLELLKFEPWENWFDENVIPEPKETSKVSDQRIYEKLNSFYDIFESFNIKVDKIKFPWKEDDLDNFNFDDFCVVWPRFIQFKFSLWKWESIKKLKSKIEDIQLQLWWWNIRLIEHIFWTRQFWIEIENPNPQSVWLREWLTSSDLVHEIDKWKKMWMIVWKKMDWTYHIQQIDDMPHLLIAWQTWSWKSISMFSMILWLMYQNDPKDLRFIMIDPKWTELSLFDWNPYLMCPVILDSQSKEDSTSIWQKAIFVLEWLTEEMARRYSVLQNLWFRDINELNKVWKQEDHMPKIIVCIEEYADLVSEKKEKTEIERLIKRLAQKARAIWIHLILSTQRPSVDVIWWVIKANIPWRIAFALPSSTDSTTIIWEWWAEWLLWKWDCLTKTQNSLIRVQAPFINTDSIKKICTYIKNRFSNKLNWRWKDNSTYYHPGLISMLNELINWNSQQEN